MALDFANEPWVRVYKRDTVTLKLLTWQARALLWELLRKADRAGVVDVGDHGERGVAAMVGMPVDVVTAALAELLACGTVRGGAGCYVLPRFLDAQETPSSDKLRARESRARRRDDAIASVTKRDDTITNRDDTVTPRHAASLREEKRQEEKRQHEGVQGEAGAPSAAPSAAARPRSRAKGKAPVLSAPEAQAVAGVLDKLSRVSGVEYRATSATHQRVVVARLRDGATEDELRAVIVHCASPKPAGLGWADNPEMRPFLRPETLFGPVSIERYLPAARKLLSELEASS